MQKFIYSALYSSLRRGCFVKYLSRITIKMDLFTFPMWRRFLVADFTVFFPNSETTFRWNVTNIVYSCTIITTPTLELFLKYLIQNEFYKNWNIVYNTSTKFLSNFFNLLILGIRVKGRCIFAYGRQLFMQIIQILFCIGWSIFQSLKI